MPTSHVSKIVPKGYNGITLWPFGIYFSDVKYLSNEIKNNHERIHWEQQKELGGIFFYLIYVVEWVVKYILNFFTKSKISAYRSLAAEREAYHYDQDTKYLLNRKRYTWLKYIFKKP